ncbi:MAG: hypothetical protein ACRDMJ_05850 [Solirubrobacteraceae bacterium]
MSTVRTDGESRNQGQRHAIAPRAVREALRRHDHRPDLRRDRPRRVERVLQAERRRGLPLRVLRG